MYTFTPSNVIVSEATEGIIFIARPVPLSNERKVFNWFKNQQLPNGLLESSENSNAVSLYDQALAAMVFMLDGDFSSAEKIFDFFNTRINSELKSGPGGFSQIRDRNGNPWNHRWMGDNAWLLIALNNYKAFTNKSNYLLLTSEIENWLQGLQDTDGGLYAGYGADDALLNYKVTEGNIDAFNAIPGYTQLHKDLLRFLKEDRWDMVDKNLMSWPGHPKYQWALDNHSWSYCMFPDYPITALTTADRFLSTQTATINGASITGYDIDEDRDAVFIEGTGQMALAFNVAGMQNKSEEIIAEMEKVLVESNLHSDSSGFPYASNIGTGYGDQPLWEGADTKIAISGGAWYLFALKGFNPFALERDKEIPEDDKFWLN